MTNENVFIVFHLVIDSFTFGIWTDNQVLDTLLLSSNPNYVWNDINANAQVIALNHCT